MNVFLTNKLSRIKVKGNKKIIFSLKKVYNDL